MNERIKELAEQCYVTGPLARDGWPEYTKFDEQKFAKLIIEECANQAAWAQDTGAKDVAGEIVKYFGVE